MKSKLLFVFALALSLSRLRLWIQAGLTTIENIVHELNQWQPC